MRRDGQRWDEVAPDGMSCCRSGKIYGSGMKSNMLGEVAQWWDDKYENEMERDAQSSRSGGIEYYLLHRVGIYRVTSAIYLTCPLTEEFLRFGAKSLTIFLLEISKLLPN